MSALNAIRANKAELSPEKIALQAAALAGAEHQGTNAAIPAIFGEATKFQPSAAIKLNPRHVRRGKYANRMLDFFTTDEFRELKSLIQETGGNTQPALVVDTGEKDNENFPIYEIVHGHCRHQACFELSEESIDGTKKDYLFLTRVLPVGTPVSMWAKETSDENKGRNDVTAWEKAVWWNALLENQEFSSAKSMAKALNEDIREVQRSVKAVREADMRIFDLLSDPRKMSIKTVESLIKLKSSQADKFETRLANLKEAGKKLLARDIFQAMTVEEVKQKIAFTYEPIVDPKSGEALGRFKRERKGGMKIELDHVLKPGAMEKISAIIAKYKS